AIVGTWKLIEARAYDDAGHELPLPFGPHPMGIAVFEAERMIVVVADGRTSLPPDAPPRGFVSYCGNYQFDGTKLVTHADGASNPVALAGRSVIPHVFPRENMSVVGSAWATSPTPPPGPGGEKGVGLDPYRISVTSCFPRPAATLA